MKGDLTAAQRRLNRCRSAVLTAKSVDEYRRAVREFIEAFGDVKRLEKRL